MSNLVPAQVRPEIRAYLRSCRNSAEVRSQSTWAEIGPGIG